MADVRPPGTPSDDPVGPASTMVLGRYRVEATLGRGGFGTVVRAFDPVIKRRVAIKTLNPGLSVAYPDAFTQLRERFVREAEAGGRMGVHPNIVAVHDLVSDADGTLYLILQYVSGGTVGERMAQGLLPLTDALRITADAARGLHAAHTRGLVHRDIKPANLFIEEDGRGLVGDWGICQMDDLSGRTRTSTSHPGTPLYMSPEQERMTAYLRPASDQYSLGLVRFEMISGQGYKRIGDRQAETLLLAQPEPVADLVRRMIADHPDDRYPSMREVEHAALAVTRGIETPPTTQAPPRDTPEVAHATLPAPPSPLFPAILPAPNWPRPPLVLYVIAALLSLPVLALLSIGLVHMIRRAIDKVPQPTATALPGQPSATAFVSVAIATQRPSATPIPSATPRTVATTGPTATLSVAATKRFVIANTDGTGANLREQPTSKSNIVMHVPEGTEVQATGPAVDGEGGTWYPVQVGNNTGFIKSDFLRAVS